MKDRDPARPGRRRTLRHPGYDYASAGAYFVTLVTHSRRCLFGEVVDATVRRNAAGDVVAACWQAVPGFFDHVILDEWIVMPNHVHGILVLRSLEDRTADGGADGDGAGEAPAATFPLGMAGDSAGASPLPEIERPWSPPTEPKVRRQAGMGRAAGTRPGSLAAVIQHFKSVTARRLRAASPSAPPTIWQRNYFEHVIRDDPALDRIRRYIRENPLRWEIDHENPAQ